MRFPRKEIVEAVRARYPKGTRVELVFMDDPYSRLTDLDNARELLSYDAPAPDGLFSGVSVRAIAVHTNRVHVFLFAVRTMWACDSEGEPEAEIRRRYRLITSF